MMKIFVLMTKPLYSFSKDWRYFFIPKKLIIHETTLHLFSDVCEVGAEDWKSVNSFWTLVFRIKHKKTRSTI